jgi:hypothetical protein
VPTLWAARSLNWKALPNSACRAGPPDPRGPCKERRRHPNYRRVRSGAREHPRFARTRLRDARTPPRGVPSPHNPQTVGVGISARQPRCESVADVARRTVRASARMRCGPPMVPRRYSTPASTARTSDLRICRFAPPRFSGSDPSRSCAWPAPECPTSCAPVRRRSPPVAHRP